MKRRTEIIRALAEMNAEDAPGAPDTIRRRTMIPEPAIRTALAEMERDGLSEDDGGWWLTERGWEAMEREMPRAVGVEMLMAYSDVDGGGE